LFECIWYPNVRIMKQILKQKMKKIQNKKKSSNLTGPRPGPSKATSPAAARAPPPSLIFFSFFFQTADRWDPLSGSSLTPGRYSSLTNPLPDATISSHPLSFQSPEVPQSRSHRNHTSPLQFPFDFRAGDVPREEKLLAGGLELRRRLRVLAVESVSSTSY
jgi:hypothetical protein